MKTTQSKTKRYKRKESVKKWSRPVLRAGFTIIPTVLFTKQHELGLDSVDINIIMQLACSWWKYDKPPFLGKGTLAQRIGIDASTVRRRIAKMEKRGLLARHDRFDKAEGQRSNFYDLRPLVEKLHPLAIKVRKEREQSRHARGAVAV